MTPLPLGARVLQAGLDANGTLVGFFLVQTARALFGLFGLFGLRRQEVCQLVGGWMGRLL